MVFVCGVFENNTLFVIDYKFYSTFKGAKNRCDQLNNSESQWKGKWIVLYQDRWIPYKEYKKEKST